MPRIELPDPLAGLVAHLTALLDRRHADLLSPLFIGQLLAHGRRTATAWFRAGGIGEDFKRAYTLLGTVGRSCTGVFAGALFHCLRRTLSPGARWLFALDDTPTQRYGPHVEGAGLHPNPTPGPAHQRYVYGHVWVTTARVVRHPQWHTQALPLRADLYLRAKDLPNIDADHRPLFVTKLQQAAQHIAWIAEELQNQTLPIGFAVDGAYAKRPVLRAAREAKVVLVSRLPKNAALRDLPPVVPEGQRRPGRPRRYGRHRLSLAKRAGHRDGWETVECFQYPKTVTKTVKTFLATWKPAGGVIRVVLVREDTAEFPTSARTRTRPWWTSWSRRRAARRSSRPSRTSRKWKARASSNCVTDRPTWRRTMGVCGATRRWRGGRGPSRLPSCVTAAPRRGTRRRDGHRTRIGVRRCSGSCWKGSFGGAGASGPAHRKSGNGWTSS